MIYAMLYAAGSACSKVALSYLKVNAISTASFPA
jgi:hypothetical protein